MTRGLTLFLVLAALSAFALELRVRERNGVALLHQDGLPIRGRMFWGGPTSSSVPVKAGPQRLTIRRLAPSDFDGGLTFHLRFGKRPSLIRFSQLAVTDITSGETLLPPCSFENGLADYRRLFRQWPAPADAPFAAVALAPGNGPDGANAIEVKLDWQENRRYPDFHLYTITIPTRLAAGHEYHITLWLDSDVETTLSLGVYEPPRGRGGMFTAKLSDGQFENQLRLAAGAGVDLVSVPIGLAWPDQTTGLYDFTAIDDFLRSVLRVNPKAKLLVRVNVNAPDWWRNAYPDEMMGWDPAVAARHRPNYSVSSRIWRDAVLTHLARLIDHLEETFPENMAGYHPGGQNTAEWFYQDSWFNHHHGFSPAETKAFREWLTRKYASDQRLQQAWNDPKATLATATAPAVDRREGSPAHGIWLLPQASQDVIDFNDFLQDEMTDALLAMARVIRTHTAGRKLSVFFYGYGYQFSSMARPSASGHNALRRLLDGPDIDILCSPISYTDRQQGGAAQSMTAAESVQLAGKVWLYEDYTATYLSSGDAPGWKEKVHTSLESRQLLVRNTAQEICRNIACWWMDLRRGGWFNDPLFWDDMRTLAAMEAPLLQNPRPYRPVIASVYDERSMLYVRGGSMVSRPLTYLGRAELARTGTSFGQYLLDDLLRGRIDSPVILLHNAWVLDQSQRQAFRQATAGKCLVWGYAAAPIDPDSPTPMSAEKMEELSGFRLRTLPTLPETCVVSATQLGRQLGLPATWSLPGGTPCPPLLYAVVPTASQRVLATWPDGSPAVVLSGKGPDASIFCAIPMVPRQLLRVALGISGQATLTDDDCVLFSQLPFIMVHATHDGPVRLRLPHAASVTEVMTGQRLGERLATLTLNLKFAETKVLRLD